VVGGGASPFSGDACAGRGGLGAGQVEADTPPFPRRRGTRPKCAKRKTLWLHSTRDVKEIAFE
jgi:hypothetical protein